MLQAVLDQLVRPRCLGALGTPCHVVSLGLKRGAFGVRAGSNISDPHTRKVTSQDYGVVYGASPGHVDGIAVSVAWFRIRKILELP